MNTEQLCAKCRSNQLIWGASLEDSRTTETTRVVKFRSPNAMIFRGKHKSTVSARVCGACGYIELYADHPSDLKITDE